MLNGVDRLRIQRITNPTWKPRRQSNKSAGQPNACEGIRRWLMTSAGPGPFQGKRGGHGGISGIVSEHNIIPANGKGSRRLPG
jgi:hypothetical protein